MGIAGRAAWGVLLGLMAGLAGCTGRPHFVSRGSEQESRLEIRNQAGVAELRWSLPCEFPTMTLHPLMVVPVTKKVIPQEIEKTHTFPTLSGTGAAYLVNDRFLEKLDLQDARVRWRLRVENRDVQVLERDGVVGCYVDLGSRGILRGIDAESGEVRWTHDRMPGRAELDAAQGRFYLQSKDTLAAVDLLNGQKLWLKRFPFGPDYFGAIYGLMVRDNAVLCDWVNRDRGAREVLALNYYTGQQDWLSQGRAMGASDKQAFIYNERTKILMARDLETGTLGKDLPLDQYDGSFLNVSGDRVLYSSVQTYFRPLGASPEGAEASEAPGSTYTRHDLLSLDFLSGQVQWAVEYRQPGELAAIVLGDDTLLVARRAEIFGYQDIVFGEIAAYALGTGELLWTAEVPTGVVNLCAGGGWVLVRTRDGWVFGLQQRRRRPGELPEPATPGVNAVEAAPLPPSGDAAPPPSQAAAPTSAPADPAPAAPK